jgi:DNA polymerase-1
LEDRNFYKKEAAERRLINNICQGSAAEIMKLAMILIDKNAPLLGLLVQVYDELLFEYQNEDCISMVRDCMIAAGKDLLVPLTVDIGTGMSWTEAHS